MRLFMFEINLQIAEMELNGREKKLMKSKIVGIELINNLMRRYLCLIAGF